MMLPKANRLTSDYDFRKVRRQGRKMKTPFFDLYYLPRGGPSSLAVSRFGFVVSLKLDKRATRRNRVRRIFREEVRSLLPKTKKGFDCAFWVRKRSLEVEPEQARRATREALRKVGVMRGE